MRPEAGAALALGAAGGAHGAAAADAGGVEFQQPGLRGWRAAARGGSGGSSRAAAAAARGPSPGAQGPGCPSARSPWRTRRPSRRRRSTGRRPRRSPRAAAWQPRGTGRPSEGKVPFQKGIGIRADRERQIGDPTHAATSPGHSSRGIRRDSAPWLPWLPWAAAGSCTELLCSVRESEDRPLGVWKVSSRGDALSRGSCSLSLLLGALVAL